MHCKTYLASLTDIRDPQMLISALESFTEEHTDVTFELLQLGARQEMFKEEPPIPNIKITTLDGTQFAVVPNVLRGIKQITLYAKWQFGETDVWMQCQPLYSGT